MKRLLGIFLLLLVAALAVTGFALYTDYRTFLDRPLTLPEAGLDYTVPRGASITGLARDLEQQGVLDRALYLQAHARLEQLASRIQAGDYHIESGTTPRQLLRQWVEGRVIQHSLTVVEGWTFRQMLEAIRRHPQLEQTLSGLSGAQIMARLGHPGEHPEGRFFPDTYLFPKGTTDLAFLERAYKAMEQRLSQAWARRDPDLPLDSPYQALILASIIERETGVPEERPQIGGVFIRRLNRGMRLQTDPTVIYGLGEEFDGNLRRRDLRSDTPYNTYTRGGLPPTPIALPGAGALAAAVNPAPGTSLYFVARGDGSHVFSDTLREHNRAVREYQLRGNR
ncbi:MAG: endolytic transglycosylase MltG [Candidatus Competibacteraceae bacterium]|nr:endolytic transglycosylase MltG [Candidatus Competibacteraceae bacterium]